MDGALVSVCTCTVLYSQKSERSFQNQIRDTESYVNLLRLLLSISHQDLVLYRLLLG